MSTFNQFDLEEMANKILDLMAPILRAVIIECLSKRDLNEFKPSGASDRKLRSLSHRQTEALNSLALLISRHGRPVTCNGVVVSAVHKNMWRENLFLVGAIDRECANPRTEFKRIKDSLLARKVIDEDGEYVFVVSGHSSAGAA